MICLVAIRVGDGSSGRMEGVRVYHVHPLVGQRHAEWRGVERSLDE
jgi:hypothetical protein